MSQSALARAVVAAEDALNSPELETARARLREIDAERVTIVRTLEDADARLLTAQQNLRAFFTGDLAPASAQEDVHAAVASIADAPPATADRSNEPEEGEQVPAGFIVADGGKLAHLAESDALPSYDDLSVDEQEAVEDVLNDDTPFAGLGGTTGLVIGRPGEVSDAAIAEAQAIERREAEHANGAARFNPWA